MGGIGGAVVFFLLLTQSFRHAEAKCFLNSGTDDCSSRGTTQYSRVTGFSMSRSSSKSSRSATKRVAYTTRFVSTSSPSEEVDSYTYNHTTTTTSNSSSYSHANATVTMETEYSMKKGDGGGVFSVVNSTEMEAVGDAIVGESHAKGKTEVEIKTTSVRDPPVKTNEADTTTSSPVEMSPEVESVEVSEVHAPPPPPAPSPSVSQSGAAADIAPLEAVPKINPVTETTHEHDLDESSAAEPEVADMLEDSMRAIEDLNYAPVAASSLPGVEPEHQPTQPTPPSDDGHSPEIQPTVIEHSPAEPKESPAEIPAHFYPCGYPKPIDPNDPEVKAEQTDPTGSVHKSCIMTETKMPAPPATPSPSPAEPSPVISPMADPSPAASSPEMPSISPLPKSLPCPSPVATLPVVSPAVPSPSPAESVPVISVSVQSPSPQTPSIVVSPKAPSPSPTEPSPVTPSPSLSVMSPIKRSPCPPEHREVVIVSPSAASQYERAFTMEESKALAKEIKGFISSGNVTGLAELVIESDDIYGLNMGLRFDEEDRREELEQSAERNSDKDVIAVKALAMAALDPKAKDKVIQLMVLIATAPDGYHFTQHRSLVVKFTEIFSDEELLQKVVESSPHTTYFRRRVLCLACTPVHSYICAHCWPSQICNAYFWCGVTKQTPRAAPSAPRSAPGASDASSQKPATSSPSAATSSPTTPKKSESAVSDGKPSPKAPRKRHGNRRRGRSRKGRKNSRSKRSQ